MSDGKSLLDWVPQSLEDAPTAYLVAGGLLLLLLLAGTAAEVPAASRGSTGPPDGFALAGLVHILVSAGSKGDCVLLLGPSGAGKTTLFLQVSAAVPPAPACCSGWPTAACVLQLRDGTCHNGTITSLVEADERCQLVGEKVCLWMQAMHKSKADR